MQENLLRETGSFDSISPLNSNLLYMQSLLNYFKNSLQEFNNITWPTQKQAIRISIIVLAFMAISAIVLGALDQIFTLGFQELIKLKF